MLADKIWVSKDRTSCLSGYDWYLLSTTLKFHFGCRLLQRFNHLLKELIGVSLSLELWNFINLINVWLTHIFGACPLKSLVDPLRKSGWFIGLITIHRAVNKKFLLSIAAVMQIVWRGSHGKAPRWILWGWRVVLEERCWSCLGSEHRCAPPKN